MAKSKYVCQNCGMISAQWLGKCSGCQSWNTLVEEAEESSGSGRPNSVSEETLEKIIRGQKKKQSMGGTGAKILRDYPSEREARYSTGISELDRVLGGGAVEGSLLLLGGDPGIGKSTLLLQALDKISQKKKVLYVTGEESTEQVKLRAQRLEVKGDKLLLAAETSLEKILQIVEEERPDVLAVDSIQTMFTSAIQSAPGSVSQVREVGARLMHLAKGAGITVILVGHVTKDGSIAGPRVLEHMVDTVLYFESPSGQAFRILRGVKNRFGSTNEIGVFEMTETGLMEVTNPSALFLNERPQAAPGSVVVGSMEGTRSLLVELQALVSKSFLAVPRRTILGIDNNRAAILLAVLEKKMGMPLYERDVFVNVVGGLHLSEPSVDLGFMVAVASSFHNVPVPANLLFLGEVGLTGEVRSVARVEDRLREAEKMGFQKCFLPHKNAEALKGKFRGMEVVAVRQANEVLEKLF